MLGGVKKQKFKVNLKKNIYIYIYFLVLFCCDVGNSGPVLKGRSKPMCGFREKFGFSCENEVLYQKLLCVLFHYKVRHCTQHGRSRAIFPFWSNIYQFTFSKLNNTILNWIDIGH